MAENTLAGAPVTISRTGYTGDLGYEIWMDAADALPVWDALMEAGNDYGIAPCGILAMDMARVEAGLFMLDVDYTAANHAWIEAQKSSPFELGLGLDREPRQARLLRRPARARARAARGLGLEARGPRGGLGRHGAAVTQGRAAAADPWHGGARQPAGHADGRQVGYASTSTWSPVLKKYIALAHLERPHYEPGTRLTMEVTVEHHAPAGRGHGGRSCRSTTPRGRRNEQRLRRHRHRRRPQRPDRRGLPRARRQEGRRARAPRLVGGAAVTEEIFPGYRFTVFSYVVSLLRPEIIRDLELPKHGLKILPLPSTVTPMDNGDYLAGWDDHDQTRREMYRHSPTRRRGVGRVFGG